MQSRLQSKPDMHLQARASTSRKRDEQRGGLPYYFHLPNRFLDAFGMGVKVTVYIAGYKGEDYWGDRLIQWWTNKIYSHCEIVIDGMCYSAASYEGRVRSKKIDLGNGNWDVTPIKGGDPEIVKQWFKDRDGAGYDYLGLAGFVFPWRTDNPKKWFCSRACVEALIAAGVDLGFKETWKVSPGQLMKAAINPAARPYNAAQES
jgi:hypothetical protein